SLMRTRRLPRQIEVLGNFLVQVLWHHPAHSIAGLFEVLFCRPSRIEFQNIDDVTHARWTIADLFIPQMPDVMRRVSGYHQRGSVGRVLSCRRISIWGFTSADRTH